MKRNSQITIILTGLVLFIRILFVFIEQNDTSSNNQNIIKPTIQTTQTTKEPTETNTKTEEIKITEVVEDRKPTIKKPIEEKITKQFTNEIKNTQDIKNTEPEIIPNEYDIQNMDFFSQSPYGNRKQPYQDACEEASLLIGQYYIKGIKKNKDEYNKDLLSMVELEMEMLGYFESTTIMEMKQIINRRDPSISARIIEHPTIQDLEREISQDNVVVAPFYGKGLGNPHYALGGPEYHFLVIKGYTTDSFITHDVGTMHGANRHYNKNLIMNNIHDRNRVDVRKGAARVLILEK